MDDWKGTPEEARGWLGRDGRLGLASTLEHLLRRAQAHALALAQRSLENESARWTPFSPELQASAVKRSLLELRDELEVLRERILSGKDEEVTKEVL